MATGSQFGAFIPTTDVFDLPSSTDLSSDEWRLFLVRLRQSINNIALIANIKDSGYYVTTEFVNGQLYFPNTDPLVTSPTQKNATYRQVYRTVVDFGALPNAATKSVAHNIPNIDSQYTATRVYAAATDPVNLIFLPIPNADITMTVDATNVNITTVANLTAFTRCFAVVEYIKE